MRFFISTLISIVRNYFLIYKVRYYMWRIESLTRKMS